MGLAATLGLTAAWICAPMSPEPATVPTPPADAASDQARDALVPSCGSCHRSDLPTAKPGALAVFDLTKDPWWATIQDEQYDALLRRVAGSSGISDDDKRAVETFVAAIRRASPPTPEP